MARMVSGETLQMRAILRTSDAGSQETHDVAEGLRPGLVQDGAGMTELAAGSSIDGGFRH